MGLSELVWDMDGTLLNTSTVVPDAFINATFELSGRTVTRDVVIGLYPVGPPSVILERLIDRSLESGEEEVYYQHLNHVQVEPFPGIIDTLRTIIYNNRYVAVVTGASHRAAQILLHNAGIASDFIVGGDELDNGKPAPDGLHYMATQLNVPVSKIAYIGDSHIDMKAARAAGCHAWSPSWGHMFNPTTPADRVLTKPTDALDFLN
ncbi:HAD family hydrolase [Haloglycomyces albus]|uniref:HAD family hydrolase n=1 Tax=Haloglycomyces albus TaxID=526067 RepID=UPI00046D6305|nr:HAD-IA family hydrolase [Haloglycomyces albus]